MKHQTKPDMALDRRSFLKFGGIAAIGMTIAGMAFMRAGPATAKGSFPITRSDAQWRKQLSPAAYSVLRQASTERAGSSPLDKERRKGTFVCKGCSNRLFSSSTKFDSGTGWPSFYRPLKGAIGTKTDYKFGYPRTEVHCMRCGGHLGHVFNDGPKPTGKRYCMNGVAMRFIAG